MANVSVYNMEGKEVGTMELNDAVFGVEVNEHLVHLAVVAQLANKRQGTQKAKTRSEVSGGGRKPWRQKGTGHARQGSTRAVSYTHLYEKGDSSYVDLLMESGSLSELLNKAEYIGKISAYDRQKLDEYVATKEQIQAKEAELEAEHGELLGLQEQTEAKYASVEQLLSAKQSELKKYESQISAAEGQLSEYEKDIKAQELSLIHI